MIELKVYDCVFMFDKSFITIIVLILLRIKKPSLVLIWFLTREPTNSLHPFTVSCLREGSRQKSYTTRQLVKYS